MKKATTTKTKTTPAIPAPVPAKKVASPVKVKAAVKPKAKASDEAPSVKSTPPLPQLTTITAEIDIGFGNTLWLRGDGPGLSWETGVVMDCVADDKWSITLKDAGAPVVFKFLVNDLSWSTGDDYVVSPGVSVSVKPTF
ncbi:MAG: hypothetical protein QM760_22040 [Nibricoccus sp.]